MRQQARRWAGIIAVLAAVTLATRFGLRLEKEGTVGATLAYMSQYFTLLTNFLVMLMMGWIALKGVASARVLRAIVVAIACVGLIYHVALAHLVSLSGLELWADHGTHTFVPLATVLWWLLFAPRPGMGLMDVFSVVLWPLLYCFYILIRAGMFSGFYPYPFLNLPEIGVAALARNIVVLTLAIAFVGLVLSWIGTRLSRRS